MLYGEKMVENYAGKTALVVYGKEEAYGGKRKRRGGSWRIWEGKKNKKKKSSIGRGRNEKGRKRG